MVVVFLHQTILDRIICKTSKNRTNLLPDVVPRRGAGLSRRLLEPR